MEDWILQKLLPAVSAIASVIAAWAAISTTRWQRRQVKAALERQPPKLTYGITQTSIAGVFELYVRMAHSSDPAKIIGYRITKPWRAKLMLAGEACVSDGLGGAKLAPSLDLSLAARTKNIPDNPTGLHNWDGNQLYIHLEPRWLSRKSIFVEILFIFCWMDRMDRQIQIKHTIKLPVTTSSADA